MVLPRMRAFAGGSTVLTRSLQRLFGGCHLTRPIVQLLKDGGFAISELDVYYEKGTPKVLGANSLGGRGRRVRCGSPPRLVRDGRA